MAILLTGLTGEVGSAIAPILQLKEKVFCLVRNGKSRITDDKLHEIPATQIIEGDISSNKYCGLDKTDLNYLKDLKINKIVHSAASVKFDKHLSDEIWTTNFTGTVNMLSLAKELNIKEFHYLSTAYATRGRNPYESSKFAAENLVKESNLPYSIYRLSIVVGNSVTGHTNGFNGYYGFFAGPHRIAERIRKKEGKDTKVPLPIYINCSFDSTLNLVPVDWVVNILSHLISNKSSNEMYNITHPSPARTRWIMEQGFKTLGITNIMYNEFLQEQPKQTDKMLRLIQKAVNKELERYRPYVTEDEIFSSDNLRIFLNSNYTDPPQITDQFLSLLLRFAIRKNFKKLSD